MRVSHFLKMRPFGKMIEQPVLGKERLSQHQIEGQEDTAQKCEKCCVGHSPILPEIVTPGFLFTLLLLFKFTRKSGQLSNQSNQGKKNPKTQETTKTEHITKLLKCPQVTSEKVDENTIS